MSHPLDHAASLARLLLRSPRTRQSDRRTWSLSRDTSQRLEAGARLRAGAAVVGAPAPSDRAGRPDRRGLRTASARTSAAGQRLAAAIHPLVERITGAVELVSASGRRSSAASCSVALMKRSLHRAADRRPCIIDVKGYVDQRGGSNLKMSAGGVETNSAADSDRSVKEKKTPSVQSKGRRRLGGKPFRGRSRTRVKGGVARRPRRRTSARERPAPGS